MWRLRGGLECLPSVPFLPSCCHHLDPVVLLTCRRKEKKHLDLLPPLLSFATLAVRYFAPCPSGLPVQGSDCGVAKRCQVETISLFWYLSVGKINTNQPYIFFKVSLQATKRNEHLRPKSWTLTMVPGATVLTVRTWTGGCTRCQAGSQSPPTTAQCPSTTNQPPSSSDPVSSLYCFVGICRSWFVNLFFSCISIHTSISIQVINSLRNI